MSLPWLADILSGLVYYFAGMLMAQREARWYGSRGLALAGAFFCSYLVWTLPEFWQALVAIGIIGSFVGVAAWGSFLAGGEYATQPRLAKAGLAMTFLAALLILSMLGKQMIGEWSDSGFEWDYGIDRQGRVMVAPIVRPLGPIGPWTDLNGQELPDLKRPMFPVYDGKDDSSIEAPSGSNGDTAPLELPQSRPILRRIQERFQARQRSLVFRPGRGPPGRIRQVLSSARWPFRPGRFYSGRRAPGGTLPRRASLPHQFVGTAQTN